MFQEYCSEVWHPAGYDAHLWFSEVTGFVVNSAAEREFIAHSGTSEQAKCGHHGSSRGQHSSGTQAAKRFSGSESVGGIKPVNQNPAGLVWLDRTVLLEGDSNG